MSDMISRQAAIEVVQNRHMMLSKEKVLLINDLKSLPPALPEIVRCKDCKYWHSGSCEYPEHAVNCQDYYVGDIETEAGHFCGYAKRREVTE